MFDAVFGETQCAKYRFDTQFNDNGLQYCRMHQEVQVGKDQEKAQSEKDSHSKNRGGKKPNQQSGTCTYTMKHIVSRMSRYFSTQVATQLP